MIGLLQCPASCARPDMRMAVHQVAKFSKNPKAYHNAAAKRIGKFLLDAIDEGLAHEPNNEKGLEALVDTDF